MTKKEALLEAKRRYPIGTRFRCSNGNTGADSINGIFTVTTYNYLGEPYHGVHSGNGWIYLYGRWATIVGEIVSDSKLKLNYLIL